MSTLKSNSIGIEPSDVFAFTSTQGTDLGAIVSTGDGRHFRYHLNGAVVEAPGKVYQGPAQDATNLSPSGGLSVAAAAVGATSITLTSSVTLTANQLSGAFLTVNVAPGTGYTLKLKGNSAVTAAAGAVINLEDPLVVALTTSSKVIVNLNPFNGVIVTPSTLTAAPVGIAIAPIPAANYGWIQTHGVVGALVTGTFASAGLAVGVLVGGTPGSLAPAIAGSPVLGYTLGISTTGEYDQVFLTID